MVPLQKVDKDGFRAMVKTLDPRYVLPGRKYFNQTAIPNLYEQHRSKLDAELRTVAYFSTTADLWSSRTMEPYLSITVHFISDDWELRNHCLQTSYFPDDHTGLIIAQGLREALDSWRLKEERQVALTTDSGANIVKAVQLNDWRKLQCFGHRLHLAIERSVKDARIELAVGVCKQIVAAFSYSWKRKRDMAIAQAELGLPKHQLKTEMPTRWGSRQKMIERVTEQERAINQVLKADKKTRHLVPSWQDMDVLEPVNKVLSPLQEFTDALSGERYVSVSYLKPVLHLFNETILAEGENDTQLTKDMKTTILTYLNEKYSDPGTDDLLDMASLLDPRFKTTYIKIEKVDEIKARAVDEIKSLLTEQQADTTGTSSALPKAVAAAAEPEVKRKKSLASFFKKQGSSTAQSRATLSDEEIKVELRSYLKAVEVDSDTDPLEWWKCHQVNFPRVAKLARKYLCIPATIAPSERAFSTGGNIVTCHRSALKPDAVDRLVFLAQNL